MLIFLFIVCFIYYRFFYSHIKIYIEFHAILFITLIEIQIHTTIICSFLKIKSLFYFSLF